MYKVLVTTYNIRHYSCAIHSIVIEFNNEADALKAVEKINSYDNKMIDFQFAMLL